MKTINIFFIFLLFCTFGNRIFSGSSHSRIINIRENDPKVSSNKSADDLFKRGSSFCSTRLLLKKINGEIGCKKFEVQKLISAKRDKDDSQKYVLIVGDSKVFKNLYEYFTDKQNSLKAAHEKIILMIEQQNDCLEKLKDGDISSLYDFINAALVSHYLVSDEQRLDLDRDFCEFKKNANVKRNKTGKRLIFKKGQCFLENYFNDLKSRAENVQLILDDVKIILLKLDSFYLDLLSRFGKNVSLPFASLKEIYLVDADLKNSYLPGVNFYNSRLMRTNFSESNLIKSNFEQSNAEGAIFKNCDLAESNMSHVDLCGVDFTKADLFRANFLYSSLEKSIFIGCMLVQANLNSVKAKKSKFDGANLKMAVLDNANFVGSSFRFSQLQEASLRGVVGSCFLEDEDGIGRIFGIDFHGANLERANLNKANLNKADLTNANLELADLGGVDLRNANLTGADLSGANVGGALFDGAIVNRAKCHKLQNLDDKQREYLVTNGALGVPDLEEDPVRKTVLPSAAA